MDDRDRVSAVQDRGLVAGQAQSVAVWFLRRSDFLVVLGALMVGIVASRFIPTGFGVALTLVLVLTYRLGFNVARARLNREPNSSPPEPR